MFTHDDIRARATDNVYPRGVSYFKDGLVDNLKWYGRQITAEVEGSDYEPYHTGVVLDANDQIDHTFCSCPYDWGGDCKHIVAVLLAVLDGGGVVQKPSIDRLVADLPVDKLRTLLHTIVTAHPETLRTLENEMAWLKSAAGEKSTAVDDVDMIAIQRDIVRLFRDLTPGRGYDMFGEYYEPVSFDELYHHLARVRELLAQQRSAAAQLVLETAVEAVLEQMEDMEAWLFDMIQDDLDDLENEIDGAVAETLLSDEQTAERREWWSAKLDDWGPGLGGLSMSVTAWEQGWEYKPLVRVLQGGEITQYGVWSPDEEIPYYADDLAHIRLRVLERREQYEQYLRLALAESCLQSYILMLIRLDRLDEAIAEAEEIFEVSDPTLVPILHQLWEKERRREALEIAYQSLLHTEKDKWYQGREVAQWVYENAPTLNEQTMVLTAARYLFSQSPSLERYLQVKKAAEHEEWRGLRGELVTELKEHDRYDNVLVQIYLHEGMYKKATQAVDDGRAHIYASTVEKVIDAVWETQPHWVIDHGRRRAEEIMDDGRSGEYQTAVDWLRPVKKAYRAAGESDKWDAYLAQLLEKHGRKYKLVPLLKTVR